MGITTCVCLALVFKKNGFSFMDGEVREKFYDHSNRV